MDEDQWLNVVGEPMDFCSISSQDQTSINLQELALDEITNEFVLNTSKKSKKNSYYVMDTNTILSCDDMQYQLIDTSDIVSEKKLIPEVLKHNTKLTDSFGKLLKSPERCLSDKLNRYYTKNLKTITKNIEDDMTISYEDIQKDVQKTIELRRNEKNEMLVDDICDSTFDILPKRKHSISDEEELSILSKIDTDFRPTVAFTERTYSRKKLLK